MSSSSSNSTARSALDLWTRADAAPPPDTLSACAMAAARSSSSLPPPPRLPPRPLLVADVAVRGRGGGRFIRLTPTRPPEGCWFRNCASCAGSTLPSDVNCEPYSSSYAAAVAADGVAAVNLRQAAARSSLLPGDTANGIFASRKRPTMSSPVSNSMRSCSCCSVRLGGGASPPKWGKATCRRPLASRKPWPDRGDNAPSPPSHPPSSGSPPALPAPSSSSSPSRAVERFDCSLSANVLWPLVNRPCFPTNRFFFALRLRSFCGRPRRGDAAVVAKPCSRLCNARRREISRDCLRRAASWARRGGSEGVDLLPASTNPPVAPVSNAGGDCVERLGASTPVSVRPRWRYPRFTATPAERRCTPSSTSGMSDSASSSAMSDNAGGTWSSATARVDGSSGADADGAR